MRVSLMNRPVILVKLHKTSGSTMAYDLYTAARKAAEATGRSFHSMNKSEYNARSFARQGCMLPSHSCLFIQHLGLTLYSQHGARLLDAWVRLSNTSRARPMILTILRAPVERTVSAYMYSQCGPANKTASMIWRHLNNSASAQACSYAHEYAHVFEKHGLPEYVGLAETILKNGADEILALSVNDPFVVTAFAELLGSKHLINFMADGNGEFTNALNYGMDLTSV